MSKHTALGVEYSLYMRIARAPLLILSVSEWILHLYGLLVSL